MADDPSAMENSASDFSCNLNVPLQLHDSDWEVGLCEIFYPKHDNVPSTSIQPYFFVLADICRPRLVNDTHLPLLRAIPLTSNNTHVGKYFNEKVFESVHYVPLFRQNVKNIKIYLRDMEGNAPSFVDYGTTVVTLHFRTLSHK